MLPGRPGNREVFFFLVSGEMRMRGAMSSFIFDQSVRGMLGVNPPRMSCKMAFASAFQLRRNGRSLSTRLFQPIQSLHPTATYTAIELATTLERFFADLKTKWRNVQTQELYRLQSSNPTPFKGACRADQQLYRHRVCLCQFGAQPS